MSIVLKTMNICKSFSGVKVLSDVNIALDKGKVHAVVGENGAGKTTLMRIICGIYQPDSGEIIFEGKPVRFLNTGDSQENGIAIIHQELNMPVNLSIAEYLFLGRTPANKFGIVRKKTALQNAEKLLEAVEIKCHPITKIHQLTVAEQQLVEIAKALSLNSRLLIMDEPTSALNQQETDNLFNIIRSLKEQGVTIIYISHKLKEISEISDDVTVMRDGCVIGSQLTSELTHEAIVKMMTGKTLDNDYFAKSASSVKTERKPIMEVKQLVSVSNRLKPISFKLYEGEVLGIAGLLGAGRTELFKAIFGVDEKVQGEIIINGKPVEIKNTSDAVREGVVLLPEDRKLEGLILQMEIMSNIAMPSLKKLSSFGVVNKRKRSAMAYEFSEQLHIKCTGINQTVSNLSGGNQQKVVFAKWIASAPKIIMLDDPTRGIDVGSKHEIYKLIRDLANRRIGVIMTSSEMPELIGICDRVLVMRDGEIVCETVNENINENYLMMIATGQKSA